MHHTATPNTKTLSIPIFALLTASLASAALSIITEGFTARLTQLSAVVLFTGAVLLIPALLLYDYTYSVNDGEFTVTRHNKKARGVLCRIYTYEITDILTKKEARAYLKKAKAEKADISVYNYCPNRLTVDYYCIICENGDGQSVIKLECSPDFASYIKYIITPTLPPEL